MNFENGFTIVFGTCGIVFCLTGLYLYNFPPKKINHLFGYRTSKSMQDQRHWDFSQKFSALRMLESGAVLILLALVTGYIDLLKNQDSLTSIVALLFVLLSVAYMFVRTQRAIDNKFKDKKNE